MKKIELTPEALKDLGSIKEYLDSEFGVKRDFMFILLGIKMSSTEDDDF